MLKRVQLGATALAYLREQLSAGYDLGQQLRSLPLESGTVFTDIPATVDITQIEDLGLSLEITLGWGTWQTSSYDPIFELITGYLQAENHRLLVTETFEAVPKVERGLISQPAFIYKGNVYYCCSTAIAATAQVDLAVCVERVLKSHRCYPTIYSLCQLEDERFLSNGLSLSPEQFDLLVNATEYIIVAAYDDEGYLVWQKNR